MNKIILCDFFKIIIPLTILLYRINQTLVNNLRPFEISCSVRHERLQSGVCGVVDVVERYIVQCTSQSVSQLQSTTCVFGDDERPPFPCKQANTEVYYIAGSFLYKFPQVLSFAYYYKNYYSI